MEASESPTGSITKDISAAEEENRAYLKPFLNKKYGLSYCDGKVDTLLRALGVGVARRAMFHTAMQRIELTENNGVYTFHIHYAFREIQTHFRIGEEFDDVNLIKKKVRTVVYQDKTKLTQVIRGEKTVTLTREFSLQPEQVLVTVQLDDIVAKRVYKPFARRL